jgi:glycosyltransferase involved in cell wall biosynthesis
MTAIIIPAHNEAAVIEQTLKGLLQQVEGDEVIVVCMAAVTLRM